MKLPSIQTVVVLGFLGLLAVAVLYLSGPSGTYSGPVPIGFTAGGKSFKFTYIATTSAERTDGLMNRKITSSTTMLFAFPSLGRPSFWMYATNTSLDMIWVNAMGGLGHVAYIVSAAPPCSISHLCRVYTPNSDSNYVIEAKAGFAASNGITVGSLIEFNYI